MKAQAHRRALSSGNVNRRSELRKRLKTAESRIARLYNAIADNLVTDTDLFRRELHAYQAERDDCNPPVAACLTLKLRTFAKRFRNNRPRPSPPT